MLLRSLGAYPYDDGVILAEILHLDGERFIQILHKSLKHIPFVPVVGIADALSVGEAGGGRDILVLSPFVAIIQQKHRLEQE